MYIHEIASSLYPWDLADRSVERCVDDVTEHADVNSVYLVGIMHKEKRPLTSMFYTLNPVRKFYLPEDKISAPDLRYKTCLSEAFFLYA